MTGYSKEQATSVLERYPEMDGRQREYWQAIIDGTLPKYYLTDFLRKRDEYSDDLPEVDVRTLSSTQGDRQIAFKCQGNYLTGLGLSLRGAIKDGVVTNKGVVNAIDSLLSSDLTFSVGDPKNKDRIDKINTTLNQVIGFLQKTV